MRRAMMALLMLMLALLPFGASAQSTVTGSGFQVQNLSDTSPATITIVYYKTDGSTDASQTEIIQAGAALTFYNGQGGTVNMKASAGFKGSVVISSDQPIAAITNLVGANLGEAYSGFSSGSGSVTAPVIVRGNFGENTVLTIQNTAATATTVNVTYTPGVVGNAGQTDSATIPAYSSVTFNQADKTGLGDRFVGSATVAAPSGSSIVAIVTKEGGNRLSVYNGFTGGAASIAMPLIVANNYGGFTGFQVVNVGAAAADVTISYSANTVTTGSDANQAVCPTPTAASFSLAAGASKLLIQTAGSAAEGFDPQFATCRYVGSASISSASSGASLVGIVNYVSGASASSYESFASNVTGTIKVPLVSANNFGQFSGVQIQNVGTASTSITLTYGPNTISGDGACPQPTARTVTLGVGASATFLQSGAGAASDGFDAQFATCRYVGSATVTSAAGSKIVGIVNFTNPTQPGDSLSTYNGFNQ